MKILIADDNEMNRSLIVALLQRKGHEVLEAEDGAQAVKLAKGHIPDLIIMDIQMPVLDGVTALRMLRADESVKKIPVIAVTSYAMKGDKERFLNAGFDSYISKPINIKEVAKFIEQYIKK